jgi:hypothetical protein
MLKKLVILVILQFLACYAYADDVTQGTSDYNWDTCVHNHTGSCVTGCQFSSDPQCGNNCQKNAEDFCKSKGFSPS